MKTMPSSERSLEGGRIADFRPPSQEQQPQGASNDDDGWWLQQQTMAFRQSNDFFDSNVRQKIEDAHARFRSEHPAGSKYNHPDFAKRSRLFRPKTRAMIRKQEAGVAMALLGNKDAVTLMPPNPGDKQQARAAKIREALLNHHLSTSVPWFKLVVGGFQDGARQGFVIARTSWEYRQGTRYFDDPQTGEKISEPFVQTDRPRVDLLPAENLRFDPGCDWLDPIQSSPYIVELVPMYVGEIVERMNNTTRSRGVRYRPLDRAALLKGVTESYDSLRQRRDGGRADRYDAMHAITDYTTVWVRRTIMRVEGVDYTFDCIGESTMLSEVVPLSEVEPRGYRPYVFGTCMIETHTPYADGPVTIMAPIQDHINEISNLRVDGVKMATVGRHYVRRGGGIDITALVRHVPGSVVEMSNINQDVKWERAPDVTQGNIEEYNAMTLEMDDLAGNFSGSSVGSNRKAGETVGGMMMFGEGANVVSEYTVRTYAVTFIEPVLKQLNDLIAFWETDLNVVTVVGEKLKADAGEVFRSLGQPLSVEVNVGFGATNPIQRVEKMQVGLSTVQAIFPDALQNADQREVLDEIYSAMGYRSAERFFPGLYQDEQDPRIQQMQAQIEQLTQMVETKQMEIDGRVQVAQVAADARVRIEEIKRAGADKEREFKLYMRELELDLKEVEINIAKEQNAIKRGEFYLQREALSHAISMAEREFQLALQTTPLAPPPQPEDKPIPPEAARQVSDLNKPSSASVASSTASLPGDDKAGVMARGQYGMIPGKEG